MPEHILESDNFSLRLSLNVFESDIEGPINTNMMVFITSNEFSAKTDMEIDIKDFARFSMELMDIYKSLKGEATIKEPYGYEKFICVVCLFSAHRNTFISSFQKKMKYETCFLAAYSRLSVCRYSTYCLNLVQCRELPIPSLG